MELNPLHPLFAAELIGTDLSREPDQALIDLVERAMARYAVLVIRGQYLSWHWIIRNMAKYFGQLSGIIAPAEPDNLKIVQQKT